MFISYHSHLCLISHLPALLFLPLSETKIMPAASKPTRPFVPLPGQEYATSVPPYAKLTPGPHGGPKINFTPEEVEAISKPNVLISGGGIGGLTLALLLLKANIPFLVLERAKETKPLGTHLFHDTLHIIQFCTETFALAGSAISMGPSVRHLFQQLGIWDEFVSRSKEYHTMSMYKEDLEPVSTMEVPWLEKAYVLVTQVSSS